MGSPSGSVPPPLPTCCHGLGVGSGGVTDLGEIPNYPAMGEMAVMLDS